MWKQLPVLCVLLAITAPLGLGATIQGTLGAAQDDAPLLRTQTGGEVRLTGDDDTMAVLRDSRLLKTTIEVSGEYVEDDFFRVGPIHTKSLWVLKDGNRYMVTYWCEVCAIRTYAPGICACCQEETELHLREEGSRQ